MDGFVCLKIVLNPRTEDIAAILDKGPFPKTFTNIGLDRTRNISASSSCRSAVRTPNIHMETCEVTMASQLMKSVRHDWIISDRIS